MGCDIHSYAEVKVNNKWQLTNKMFKDPYYRADEKESVWNTKLTVHPCDIRNYELFAFLAGVRNSYNMSPLALPKGLPADTSNEVKKESDSWDCDGHSHSWFSLKELKEADLTQEFYDNRLITSKDVNGNVTSTCSMTTGKHLGKVGQRKLFELWHDNPVQDIINNLETIKEGRNDEEVRIVFWFDN